MWVARTDDGYLFGGLTADAVETLRGVPMLIESTDERVRARLLPETYDDHGAEEQWREHATPELERLFVSRTVIVRKDLAVMRELKSGEGSVLLIPMGHVNAWLATLNAARLALYALNNLTAEHMDRDPPPDSTTKQLAAAARIHFLAEVQCVLLGEFRMAEDEETDDPGTGATEAAGE